MKSPDAYVGHDGRLVARCPCGWWAAGTAEQAALTALLEHRKTCETPHPGGEATEGGAFEGYRP